MSEPSQPKTLRDVWRAIFSRRWFFLLTTCLATLAVLLLSQVLQLKYTGTARFERRTPKSTAEGGVGVTQSSLAVYRNTLRDDIMGKHAIDKVIGMKNLYKNLPQENGELTDAGRRMKSDMIRAMQKNTHFNYEVRTDETDRITVSFTSDNPTLAKEIPDALIQEYINRINKKVLDKLTESEKYAAEQLRKNTEFLDRARKRRLEFEVLHAGKLFDDSGSMGQRIELLKSEIDDLNRQIAAARKKKALFEELVKQADGDKEPGQKRVQTEKGPNPVWDRLQEQLRQAEEQLSIALDVSGMKENHPTVESLRLNIKRIKKQLETTERIIVLREIELPPGVESYDPNAAELNKAKSDLEAAQEALVKKNYDLDRLTDLLTQSGPLRQQYARLVSEEDLQQKEANLWAGRQSEIKENLAAQVARKRTQLEMVETAEEQHRPSWPVWWQLLVISIAVGLAFGGGLVFVFNLLDRSIKTTDEAMTEFDIPLYGVVGEILTPADRMRNNVMRYIVVPIVSTVIVLALALAVGDLILKLQWPDQHGLWRAEPFGYVVEQINAIFSQPPEGS